MIISREESGKKKTAKKAASTRKRTPTQIVSSLVPGIPRSVIEKYLTPQVRSPKRKVASQGSAELSARSREHYGPLYWPGYGGGKGSPKRARNVRGSRRY